MVGHGAIGRMAYAHPAGWLPTIESNLWVSPVCR